MKMEKTLKAIGRLPARDAKKLKTVTRDELFSFLYENFDVLPDWDEARDEEGYVSINFYVDEKVEENE